MGLMKMKYKVVWSLAVMLMASNAVAQEKQDHVKSSDTKLKVVEDKMAGKEEMGDQSRIICRKIQETGSRLRAKRICATAAEWAAQKQQNRESTERTQAARYKSQ